jgi:hypothetical protein
MVRAENVSAKPNTWNGLKCMLAIETPDRKLWPQAETETGTFDWRQVWFTARVPTNATAVRLVLGLEQVKGKAWFDDVTVAVAKPPVRREAKPVVGPPLPGHGLPRLRGAMISPDIDAAGLRVLGREWKANLIRWQLIRRGRAGQPSTLEDYDAWLESELKKLAAHGWDWSYHAFREWSGWSVEHGSDRSNTAPATIPTRRQQLLRQWFARNQKP